MTVLHPALHRTRVGVVAAVAVVVVPVVLAAPARADRTITTLGPLSGITITSDLNCGVNQVGDRSGEWFSDLACGTFVAIGSNVYGPASVPAGFAPTPWTPVSQSPVSGDGTTAAPYRLTTKVKAGNTGVQLTQVDTYVAGEQSYRTDVTLTNTGTTSRPLVLSRAGDCFFSDSDTGFGRVDDGTTPACVAPSFADPDAPGPRVESFVPLSAGSAYDVEGYSTMWSVVAGGGGFQDVCRCDAAEGSYDNGMGLSWSSTLAAGGAATYSHLTRFSPPPLRTTVTADDEAVVPGSDDGFAISLANPTSQDVTVDAVVDTLPDGFAYTPGSTTGDIAVDPVVSGSELRWTGPFTVAAGDTLDLHLGVDVGADTRIATDTATAEVSTPADQTVAPGSADVDVAPVTLTSVAPRAVPMGTQTSFTATGSTFSAGGRITVSGRGVTVSGLGLTTSRQLDGVLRVTATAPVGARTVTYTDPDGTVATCARCLTITARPTITAVTPAAIGQGATGVTVLVDGSGFQRTASVSLSGGQVTRKVFVSATQLRLQVSIDPAASTGPTDLTVYNPDGATAAATFTITAAPRVTAANPATVARGITQQVTFTGRNLVAGVVVTTNAAGVTIGTPTAVTATSFVAAVTVTSGAATGKPTLTVVNPDGGRSTARVLTIS